MREWLFGPVDEAAALDDLRHREINYGPAAAPEDGLPKGIGTSTPLRPSSLASRPASPSRAVPGRRRAVW